MGNSENKHGSPHSLSRRVLNSMSLFGSVEALTMLCAVVRTKLAAIFIGTAGVGLLGLFTTVIELLSTLAQLGIRTTAVREIATSPEDSKPLAVAVTLRVGAILAVAGIVITAFASPLLSQISFGDWRHVTPFMILSVAVGANVIVATRSAILQGEQRLKSIAKASACSAITALIITAPLIIILRMQSIIPILLTYSGVTLISYIYFSRTDVKMPKVRWSDIANSSNSFVKLGTFLTVSGVLTWLASYAVMSFINLKGGESAMGLYQAGYSLSVKYVGVIFTAMSVEFFPRLSEALASGIKRGSVMLRHETILSVTVIVAVGAVMIAFAPWIVNLLYSSEFHQVVPMVILSTPGIVLRAVSWSMGYTILAQGRGKLFMFTEGASCLVNLLCMCGGYMLWGIPGLGLAFSIWYLAYTAIVSIVTERGLKIRLGKRTWLWSLVSVSIMSLLAFISLTCSVWLTFTSAIVVSFTAIICVKRMWSR